MDPWKHYTIPAKPDVDWMLRKLGGENAAQKFLGRLNPLVEEATGVVGPVGVFKPVAISSMGENRVVLDGIEMESRVLRVNLEGVDRVFVFVGTCGAALTKWMLSRGNVLERYLAGIVLDGILAAALDEFFRRVASDFSLDKTAIMTPGSLEDWPLSEQKKLFALLGDTSGKTGVRLTETMMMEPLHSVSGILFPTENDFVSCMLCPKLKCPDRRAPFDRQLHAGKFGLRH